MFFCRKYLFWLVLSQPRQNHISIYIYICIHMHVMHPHYMYSIPIQPFETTFEPSPFLGYATSRFAARPGLSPPPPNAAPPPARLHRADAHCAVGPPGPHRPAPRRHQRFAAVALAPLQAAIRQALPYASPSLPPPPPNPTHPQLLIDSL